MPSSVTRRLGLQTDDDPSHPQVIRAQVTEPAQVVGSDPFARLGFNRPVHC